VTDIGGRPQPRHTMVVPSAADLRSHAMTHPSLQRRSTEAMPFHLKNTQVRYRAIRKKSNQKKSNAHNRWACDHDVQLLSIRTAAPKAELLNLDDPNADRRQTCGRMSTGRSVRYGPPDQSNRRQGPIAKFVNAALSDDRVIF